MDLGRTNKFCEHLRYLRIAADSSKPTIKNKLKDLSDEFEKFNVQSVLVLNYK